MANKTNVCRCGGEVDRLNLCIECLIIHPEGTDEPWETDHTRYVRMVFIYLKAQLPSVIDDTPYPADGLRPELLAERLTDFL